MSKICSGCLLSGTCKKAKVVGETDARFLVIVDPPDKKMVYNQMALKEGALDIFAEYMGNAGFEEKDFCFFPYVRCVYDKDVFVATEKKSIEKQCRNWLLEVIDHVSPDVIIPVGADAAKAVEGRAVKITKVRGILKFNEEHDTNVFTLMDPQQVYLRPEHNPIFASDCNSLARVVDNNYDVRAAGQDVLGEYEIVDDLQFLIDQEPEVLAFDCETTNYDNPGPRWQDQDGDIVSMQFSTAPGNGYMVVLNHSEYKMPKRKKAKIKEQLRELLTNPKTSVVGQNLKFDAMWVISRFKFRYRIDHDTLMMAAIIDENALTKDLDTLVKIYAPAMAGYADQFNNAFDKAHMDLVPLDDLVDYGCGDTDATLRVYIALRKLLEDDERLWEHYRFVSMPGINAFVPVERRGMLIDENALDDFELELAESVHEQYVSLLNEVPKSIRRKHLRDPRNIKKPPSKTLAFTRPDFTRDILFHHKDGFRLEPVVFTESTKKLDRARQIPSTSTKDHLPYFFEECPFAERLSNYIKEERLLGTNVLRFRDNYMLDGKIHPVFSLWTAVTGRCLTGDSRVVTNFGSMTMLEIGGYFAERRNPGNGGLKVLTHRNRLRAVYDFIKNGEKEVFKVTSECGRSIKATSNHPFLTDRGWVELSDLQVGDEVIAYDFNFVEYEIDDEEWRSCTVDSGYAVSSLGRVKFLGDKFHRERLLLPTMKGEWGHQKVRLRKNGKDVPVHNLVAEAFLGDKPEGCEISHINGLPADNRVHNLEYATSQQNADRMVEHGRSRRDANHNQSKYPAELIRRIRRMHQRGKDCAEIGRIAGIDRRYVWQICNAGRRQRQVDVFTTYTITSIELVGVMPTYDISVEDDHSLIAEGFVVHNTASRDPNGQNFPKRGKAAKAYRKIFVAPPGFVILEADLSQAELRISADMADERVMIDIYREGGDIHARTAAGTMGTPVEEFMVGLSDETPLIDVDYDWPGSGVFLRALSEEKRRTATVAAFCAFKRFQAKAINFGFIYGMGWRKFVGYAKTQYGVDFTDSEAMATRDTFFDTYPGLPGWHREIRQYVRDNGYVRSYSGRVRHLPMVWSSDQGIASEAERQAINSPVQEFASSLGVMSMGRIDAEVDPRCLAVTGFVHDALYALVPLENIEWAAKTLKYYMESNPLDEWFGCKLKLPIVADVGFGLNGGNTHEMKGLSQDEEYNFERLGELGFELPPQRTPENDGMVDTPKHLQIHW